MMFWMTFKHICNGWSIFWIGIILVKLQFKIKVCSWTYGKIIFQIWKLVQCTNYPLCMGMGIWTVLEEDICQIWMLPILEIGSNLYMKYIRKHN
jgi:hypothetical protein